MFVVSGSVIYVKQKAANQKYVGPYPPPSMYGIDSMSTKDRETFFQWYNDLQIRFYEGNAGLLCL